ncbi:nuclear transport factor 2 family protein [Nocardioides massiliensis]|uniref:SnoaL-like domain-containing protein n=1 Tax=Nocardioides massiliensis TaxID=1325935 RepID=A0ABT9NM76_9ACTN|nr:nuclear transport factor 2 family protein [Nocardioides massiliensis]MDP9821528.1 hypothetical protein [Nocardioides massiliensis]
MDVQEITDRLEIEAALHRYTRAIDFGEWDLLDTVFTPDAAIDYTESGGIADAFGVVKPWLAENLPLFPRRQHILGQVVIDAGAPSVRAGADRARVTAYFVNPMVLVQPDGSELLWEFGGFYHHEMARTADGWRSEKLHEEIAWKRGV